MHVIEKQRKNYINDNGACFYKICIYIKRNHQRTNLNRYNYIPKNSRDFSISGGEERKGEGREKRRKNSIAIYYTFNVTNRYISMRIDTAARTYDLFHDVVAVVNNNRICWILLDGLDRF